MVTAKQIKESIEIANIIRIPRELRTYFDADSGVPMWGEGVGAVRGFFGERTRDRFTKKGARIAYTISKRTGRIVEIGIPTCWDVEPDHDGSIRRELEGWEKTESYKLSEDE